MSSTSVPHAPGADHDLPGLHGPRRRRGCKSLVEFTSAVAAAAAPLLFLLAVLAAHLGAVR